MPGDQTIKYIAAAFDAYLRANGLGRTAQRHAVVAHILDGPSHFDIEELIDLVRRQKAGVSRATVYRTIGCLEKAGFIRKMDFNKQHAHYEVAVRGIHHEHLVCERCGKITEFTDPVLEQRIKQMAAENKLNITKHRVEIFGVCRQCRRKRPDTGSGKKDGGCDP